MADSSYYYNLYKQKRDDVKSYDEDIRELNKVLGNLTNTMDDEIRAVNQGFEELKSDLNISVRHNARYTAQANSITSEKEKVVTADPLLSIAVRGLEEEISRVSGLKNTSINDRDYYYLKYKEKKEEERKAFWDKIF